MFTHLDDVTLVLKESFSLKKIQHIPIDSIVRYIYTIDNDDNPRFKYLHQITLSNGDICFTKQFCQQQWAGGPTADLHISTSTSIFQSTYKRTIYIYIYSNRSLDWKTCLQLEDNRIEIQYCIAIHGLVFVCNVC